MDTGFEEVEPLEPGIVIPETPSARINDPSSLKLRKLIVLPLMLVLVTFLMYPVGLLVPSVSALTSLVAVVSGGLAVVTVVVMMILTLKARKTHQDLIARVAAEISVLLQKKYELDVTPYLTQTLITGSSLPLALGGKVERVRLVNQKGEAVLYQQV